MRLFFSLSVFVLTISVSTSASFCPNHLKTKEVLGFDRRSLETEINRKIGERSLYQSILSSDLDFLRTEVKIDGPGAQRNMRIESPSKQFRFNAESAAVFKAKKKLISRYPEKIIGVLPKHEKDVRNAVVEQFSLILDEFPKNHPHLFRREGDTLINLLTDDRLSLKGLSKMNAREGLENLGNFVPDDLIFMKKIGEEYVLIGGNLAFPTRWNIDSFVGSSISEIHQFLTGTEHGPGAFSVMINKILDRTLDTSDIPCRNNWFVEADPRYPLPAYQTTRYASPENITKANYLKSTFIRTERQSLRGLSQSKTVLFAIQPFVFPLGAVMDDRDLAEQVLKQIKTKFQSESSEDLGKQVAKYLEEDLGSNPNRIETKALSLSKVNDGTYHISVEKPDGVSLVPGEAVRLTLETPTGKETRTLSLANSPDAATFEFATKDSNSEFKKTFKAIVPGTKVQIELLRTSLEFDMGHPMVMIAGGIGITPFRSVIQQIQEKGLDTKLWLLYGNRDQIAFGEELGAVAAKNPSLKIHHVLSQPTEAWTGTKGRIDKNFLTSFVSTVPPDARFYIVATPQMTEDVRAALRELGIPEDRISVEAFPGSSGGKQNAAIDPKTVKDCDTICYCHRVTAGKLRESVKDGLNTLDLLQAKTSAGTGCGGCLANIMKLLECELAKTP